jgi:protein SCO1/2
VLFLAASAVGPRNASAQSGDDAAGVPAASAEAAAGAGQDEARQDAPSAAQSSPRGIPKGVGIDEQLGQTVQKDAVFLDETGEQVRIGDFLDGETPVILNFVYHDCPMLCNLLLEGFSKTLRDMKFTPGQEFDIVTVSFSPTETPDLAASQKEKYLAALGRPAAADGWHFLTGTEEEIGRLAESTGFEFRWIESRQQYAHPAALIFLSGNGKITRYIHGMTFQPNDVRRAIVEASDGKVGSAVDQVFLFCYQYDPGANSYVLHATNLMKLGGLLTLLVMGAGLFLFWRRERRGQHAAPENWPSPETA